MRSHTKPIAIYPKIGTKRAFTFKDEQLNNYFKKTRKYLQK